MSSFLGGDLPNTIFKARNLQDIRDVQSNLEEGLFGYYIKVNGWVAFRMSLAPFQYKNQRFQDTSKKREAFLEKEKSMMQQ